jgi:G3E family GTPase
VTNAAAIPVSVVTGFLGAGKSSLLNKLLRAPELSGALVIVNEWGEIGLDHLLIERISGDVILLSSGCLCCSLRGDLLDALSDLAKRRDEGRIAPFDRIIIETSGLADPTPALHAIMSDQALAARYRLAGVVTLVDAVNGWATLQKFRESWRQVALADRLAIAKSDLLDKADRAARLGDLTKRLRAINPGAPIVDIAAGEFNAHDLITLDRFDNANSPEAGSGGQIAESGRHAASVNAYSFRLDRPVSAQDFSRFLALLRAALGPRLLRVKGMVALAEHPSQPLIIHGVQHVFHPPRRLKHWPDEDRSTRIVIVGDGVDRAVVDSLWAALSGAPQIDAPDLTALADNPLTVSRGGLLA